MGFFFCMYVFVTDRLVCLDGGRCNYWGYSRRWWRGRGLSGCFQRSCGLWLLIRLMGRRLGTGVMLRPACNTMLVRCLDI